MIYTIENELLKIDIDSFGAQMMSIYSKQTGIEYLWQGNKAIWGGRAYNLFPTIGRMYGNEYTYEGKRYSLRNHGIARYYEFTAMPQTTATEITFVLTENAAEDILAQYPFEFSYSVTFSLDENRIGVRHEAKNTGAKTLICAFGGHPGFNVPFDGGAFEDYYVEFDEATDAIQHLMTPAKFISGETMPYPLVDGVKIPLQHSLFDNDAVILSNTCGAATLRRDGSNKYVKMYYRDFQYFALWHIEGNSPYVCFEPWQVLCASDGIVDDLATKKDMLHIAPGDSASAAFVIEIGE